MIPSPPTVILNLETLGKCFPSFLEKLKSLLFLVFITHTVSAEKETYGLGQVECHYILLQLIQVFLLQLNGNTIEAISTKWVFEVLSGLVEFLHPTMQGVVLAPVKELCSFDGFSLGGGRKLALYFVCVLI